MLDKYCVSDKKAETFSRNQIAYLAAVICVGTAIRILYQYNRPFVGDEIGTLMYIEMSISFLLSHFESWLTMNYFIVLEKVISYLGGRNQISLCMIPLLASIATIPLTAMLTRMLTSTKVALIAATLVATNPYLISFSTVIRAYSLLTALSLAALILCVKWYRHRTLINGIYLSLTCYILMLSHLNGAYVLVYIVVIVSVDYLFSLRSKRPLCLSTLVIPLLTSLLFVVASYIKIIPEIKTWGIPWHDVPPTSISYLPYILSQYFGSGYNTWLSLVFLIGALFMTFKKERPLFVLFPLIILTIVLISIQGISHFPWAYARFEIFLVPIYIIFISEGLCYYAACSARRTTLIEVGLLILLLISWIPDLHRIFLDKVEYPWHRAASVIQASYREGDIILYGAWHIEHNLYPYFPKALYTQMQLATYSEREYEKEGGGKLYVIIEAPHLTTHYENVILEKLQVIIYPFNSYQHSLSYIINDILKSIKVGDLSPEMTNHYHYLSCMTMKLGQNDDSLKYLQLHMLCLRLTERQRHIPRSLQYFESTSIAKQLISK